MCPHDATPVGHRSSINREAFSLFVTHRGCLSPGSNSENKSSKNTLLPVMHSSSHRTFASDCSLKCILWKKIERRRPTCSRHERCRFWAGARIRSALPGNCDFLKFLPHTAVANVLCVTNRSQLSWAIVVFLLRVLVAARLCGASPLLTSLKL